MKRQLLLSLIFIAVCSFGLGYVAGLRDGGRYVQTITDCGTDRECITAAGGEPRKILD